MTLTPKGRWTIPLKIFTAAFASFITLSTAHQSISFPTPISFDLTCRVGLGRNCPGPCPSRNLRRDQSPNNPSVTVRRGGVLPVHILKNNHVGGFSRWSLVQVPDMYNKKKHFENAFLYSCGDELVTFCTTSNQERDCKVDRLNQYFRHNLLIPKVYPDGHYVLGWVWYGGAVSTGTHGAFGDYYDCIYVRVDGGPRESSYQPVFKAGETLTGRNGFCRATTNRVGHCFREPCPFGVRETTLMKPAEFDGKEPMKILRKNFERHSGKIKVDNFGVGMEPNRINHAHLKPMSTPKPAETPAPKPFERPSNPQQTPASHRENKDKELGSRSSEDGGKDKNKLSTASAEKIPKDQKRREKILRKKAKKREKREKRLRKAEAKKAKREAKRLRRKKNKEQKAIRKEKRRAEKQRKKEARKARKQAQKQAARERKLRGNRSLAHSPDEQSIHENEEPLHENRRNNDEKHHSVRARSATI